MAYIIFFNKDYQTNSNILSTNSTTIEINLIQIKYPLNFMLLIKKVDEILQLWLMTPIKI